jgi:putative ATPase
VSKIGFPEARIILAQAVIYLCASPKSNSAYLAINSALKSVRNGKVLEIPDSIKQNAQGYLYPHDFGGYVKQRYLWETLQFVEFKSIGYERKMKEWMQNIHNFS